jgi:L-ascorbate metabolism protein UlaG (beta-lactamase superfamily)
LTTYQSGEQQHSIIQLKVARGGNSVYTAKFGNIIFCHPGDLGHELLQSQISDMGAVNVLFIPVGGFYTIGREQARSMMKSIKPKVTVPMHCKLPGMSTTFNALTTVEDFTRTGDNVKRLDGPSFTVTKALVHKKGVIIVKKLGR